MRVRKITALSRETDLGVLHESADCDTLSYAFWLSYEADRMALFGDNLTIYTTRRSFGVTTQALQRSINNFKAWAKERGLSFSPSKTAEMVFNKIKKKD